jgi:diguanylate cyclase (GGDEF)-like protein/PAS domain S-box-containing protein
MHQFVEPEGEPDAELAPICRINNGSAAHFCGIATDYLQFQARLAMAEYAAGIGMWEYSQDADTMDWSPEQFVLHGVDPAQGVPNFKQWLALLEPEDRPQILRSIDDLRSGRTRSVRQEFRIRRPSDGAWRWLASFARLVPGHGAEPARMAGINVDVTDLREAEAKLRDTAELLHLVQGALGVGVWAIDPASGAGTWSPAEFALFGIDPAGGPPSVETWLTMVEAEDRARVARANNDLIEGRTDTFQQKFRIRRADDGALRWLFGLGRLAPAACGGRRLVGVTLDVTDQQTADTEKRRTDALFRGTFEQAAVGMAHLSFHGTLIRANECLCRMLGYTHDEMMRLELGDVLAAGDMVASRAALASVSSCQTNVYRADRQYVRKDGAAIWVTVTISMVRDEAGMPRHLMAVVEDLTPRKMAELALQESEVRARRLFDGAPLPSYIVDPESTVIVDSNEAASAMLGYTRSEFRGKRLSEVDVTPVGRTSMPQKLLQSDQAQRFETQQRARSGVVHDVVVAAVPVMIGGRRLAHGTVVDISDRKRAEAHLKAQAENDTLTKLNSRGWFLSALEAALQKGGPTAPRPGALILMDIDHFKQVNDTLGHDAGDALLVEIAARLRARCRNGEIAARLGGDEFALLIPGPGEERAISGRMADIASAMAQPIELEAGTLHATVSMGATSFPRDGAAAKDLLKNADLALYEAKRSGRACWRFFRPEQADSLARRVQMTNALRRAIAARTIQIAFQPKRLLNGGHAGFEALARWHDGTRFVPPDEFVPVAEATGLIRPLSRLVMDLALARLKALRGKRCAPGRVAVNVTGADLMDPGFLVQLRASLRHYRLQPADLELEVTETVLLGHAAGQVETVLRSLRDIGVAIALDDFGTGFASLAHISRLAVDRLKIDRSFIADIGRDRRGEMVARTIIHLARELDIESVAEGVETPAQLAFLAAEGCGAVQGYLISHPLLTQAEAAAYLAGQQDTQAA